jgi:hypothetical protein
VKISVDLGDRSRNSDTRLRLRVSCGGKVGLGVAPLNTMHKTVQHALGRTSMTNHVCVCM